MGNNIKSFKLIISFYFSIFVFFCISINFLACKSLDEARKKFLAGEYLTAIDMASKENTVEAKILEARIISIYTKFFKKDIEAINNYKRAHDLSLSAIESSLENNSDAYVEAAHSLGRYGQEIGIGRAISEGIAEKVAYYLKEALKLNNDNLLANLSFGIWHAEIINQAGRTFGKILFGADVKKARNYLFKAKQNNPNEIGVYYELAYGFNLLGKDEDIIVSIELLKQLISTESKSHMDNLYKEKATILKKMISEKIN